MTIDSTWLVDLRPTFGTTSDSRLGIRFSSYYNGSNENFDREVERHMSSQELAIRFKSATIEQKSTQFLYETLGEQWKEDTTRSEPARKTHQLYSSFVFEADRTKMRIVAGIVKNELEIFRDRFRNHRCLAQCSFIHAGGEASKKRRSESAFRWRECVHHGYIMIEYDDLFAERELRNFFGTFKERLKPYSMMGRAAFINFPDNTYNLESYQRKYFGSNRRKLQQIKKTWDKDNYFDWFQGIRQQTGSTLPGINESDNEDSTEEDDTDMDESNVKPRTEVEWELFNVSSSAAFYNLSAKNNAVWWRI